MIVKQFLGCSVDWLTLAVPGLPLCLLEQAEEFTRASGVWTMKAKVPDIGVMLFKDIRPGLKGDVAPFSVQFQGKFFSNQVGEWREIMLGIPWRITRLDFRFDYVGEFVERPRHGFVADYSFDGAGSGWRYGRGVCGYNIRNYDKTRESQGQHNAIYGVDERVIRLEIQVNSKLISQLGIAENFEAVRSVAVNRQGVCIVYRAYICNFDFLISNCRIYIF